MARHGTWLSLACGAQPFWLLLIAFGALVFTVSTSTDADRDTAHEARAISSARLSAALRALVFKNGPSPPSKASDVMWHRQQCTLYSEPDNVSTVREAWSFTRGVPQVCFISTLHFE
jgi:hypothetical protein